MNACTHTCACVVKLMHCVKGIGLNAMVHALIHVVTHSYFEVDALCFLHTVHQLQSSCGLLHVWVHGSTAFSPTPFTQCINLLLKYMYGCMHSLTECHGSIHSCTATLSWCTVQSKWWGYDVGGSHAVAMSKRYTSHTSWHVRYICEANTCMTCCISLQFLCNLLEQA